MVVLVLIVMEHILEPSLQIASFAICDLCCMLYHSQRVRVVVVKMRERKFCGPPVVIVESASANVMSCLPAPYANIEQCFTHCVCAGQALLHDLVNWV